MKFARWLLALFLASSGACSATQEATVEDRRHDLAVARAEEYQNQGFDEAAAVLADGDVSSAEYDRMVASYIECMTAAGATMSEPIPNPANPRILIVEAEDFGSDLNAYNAALPGL